MKNNEELRTLLRQEEELSEKIRELESRKQPKHKIERELNLDLDGSDSEDDANEAVNVILEGELENKKNRLQKKKTDLQDAFKNNFKLRAKEEELNYNIAIKQGNKDFTLEELLKRVDELNEEIDLIRDLLGKSEDKTARSKISSLKIQLIENVSKCKSFIEQHVVSSETSTRDSIGEHYLVAVKLGEYSKFLEGVVNTAEDLVVHQQEFTKR